MEKAKHDTLLGLIFFGGLALLIWATAELSALSFLSRDTLTVRFPNAAGLKSGDPVYVVGTRTGQVKKVELAPDPRHRGYRIVVTMELDRMPVLHADYRIEITDANLLGGKQVGIDPGEADELNKSPVVLGYTPGNIVATLGDADIAGTLDAAKKFFENMRDPQGTVGALIRERTLYDEVLGSFRSLRKSIEAIEHQEGALGRFVNDPEMGLQIAEVVRELRDVANKINHGRGPFGRLVNDEAFAERMATIVDDLSTVTQRIRKGEGALGKVLMDERFALGVEDLVTHWAEVGRKINDPKAGLLGMVTGDPTLAESFRTTVDGLRDFATGISRGEGTLAMLVNDKDLAEKLKRMFTQVARAIEDAREAAPIGSFFQVLVGAF